MLREHVGLLKKVCRQKAVYCLKDVRRQVSMLMARPVAQSAEQRKWHAWPTAAHWIALPGVDQLMLPAACLHASLPARLPVRTVLSGTTRPQNP